MKLRLVDLNPKFLHFETKDSFSYTDEFETADGVMFACPKCCAAAGGDNKVHKIICWTPKIAKEVSPQPGRWAMHGSGYSDLTLRAGSSSVMLTAGCFAHFFVTDGNIIQSGDGGDY